MRDTCDHAPTGAMRAHAHTPDRLLRRVLRATAQAVTPYPFPGGEDDLCPVCGADPIPAPTDSLGRVVHARGVAA